MSHKEGNRTSWSVDRRVIADIVNEVRCYDGIEENEAVDANDADADDDDAFVGLIVVVAAVGKDILPYERSLPMEFGDMMNRGAVDSQFGSGRKWMMVVGRMLLVRVVILIKDRNSALC